MPSFEFLVAAMPEGSYFYEPEDRHPTFFLFFFFFAISTLDFIPVTCD